MTALDRRAGELRLLAEDFLGRLRVVDAAAAGGPSAGLSLPELRLVEYLGDSGPRIMRELAAYLRLAVNSVTTTVDNLEAKGVVRRERSAEDRRVVRVGLTDAGTAAYHAAVGAKVGVLRGLLAALSDDEQESFLALFRKATTGSRSRAEKLAPPARFVRRHSFRPWLPFWKNCP